MSESGVFITGTDTDVGKTYVAACLLELLVSSGLRVAGLKPIASGFDKGCDGLYHNADVDELTRAANVKLPSDVVNRYGFKPAIAPHIAAFKEGVSIDLEKIVADYRAASVVSDFVVVEGVGGWHVPLQMRLECVSGSASTSGIVSVKDIESLAQALALPVVMVVGLRLGCINHAVLTENAILQSGVPVLGWVANHIDSGFSHVDENLLALSNKLQSDMLFEVPFHGGIERPSIVLQKLKNLAE